VDAGDRDQATTKERTEVGMKPRVKDWHCRRLWMLLNDGKWHKSKDIDMISRMIRAVCEEKPNHFLSSQKGYKLVKYATDEEINISIADLRSRMKHLDARASGLESALYERSNGQLQLEER